MTNSFDTIRLEIDQRGVASLVLNRPDKHNALNAIMIRELTQVAVQLSHDTNVRIVVLSALGKSFCAGADLAWMREQFLADRTARISQASNFSTMLQAFDNLPKLLIAIVEGPAYGGGVGLVSTCDIVLAIPNACFTLSENKLGIIPATIAPFVTRRIGAANMRRFALNASPMPADVALSIGLVSELYEPHLLNEALEKQVGLALSCAPGAVAAAKKLFRRLAAGTAEPGETVEALADRWESSEGKQGIEAFFEQRKPPWAI